ncbi:MAG: hypothetical protein GY714_19085 [Desulfobacterales bacterium]|nr:hypothetical protein [Desulfobacterales bacterium]MCP4159298.1 hypothetical protein [Deltaproteobacteria bacterium]
MKAYKTMNIIIKTLVIALMITPIGCSFKNKKTDSTYLFPKNFYAYQKVKVVNNNKEFIMMAQLQRSKSEDRVVFLDSIMLTPILSYRMRDKKENIKWHIKKPKELPLPEDKLFHLIFYVYNQNRDSEEQIKFTEFKDFSGCLFPKKIEIRWTKAPGILIQIFTEELDCLMN